MCGLQLMARRMLFFLFQRRYTDHVRIPLNCAMELFEAADLFMIPRLKTICEKRMLQSISVSNAASIFYGMCVVRWTVPSACNGTYIPASLTTACHYLQRQTCIQPPPCDKRPKTTFFPTLKRFPRHVALKKWDAAILTWSLSYSRVDKLL